MACSTLMDAKITALIGRPIVECTGDGIVVGVIDDDSRRRVVA